MTLRSGIFCVLMMLAGCAMQAEQSAPKVQAAPTRPAGVAGTILAMRPVVPERPGPTRILLSSLGGTGENSDAHVFEFIVRTQSGTTLAIVQPQTGDLRPGERVSILSGTETHINAAPSD
jgi:outer membrane lipoprotein SlyB